MLFNACSGPTWWSSNGVQNLAVTALINLAKLKDPLPYLQNNYNASIMFLALKIKTMPLNHFLLYCMHHSYTLKRYSHRARMKSHARGWPITLLAIDPIVPVASCLRIFSGSRVYSRNLVSKAKRWNGGRIETNNFEFLKACPYNRLKRWKSITYTC